MSNCLSRMSGLVIIHITSAALFKLSIKYTHVTDAMRQTAAAKINRGIGKYGPQDKPGSDDEGFTQAAETHRRAVFEPYKGKKRKRGTGCLTQIGEHLWEGRYSPKWPDGKIHSRNVYASTESECEAKLAELIREMKVEIAEAKELTAQGKLNEAMALPNEKKPRGARTA